MNLVSPKTCLFTATKSRARKKKVAPEKKSRARKKSHARKKKSRAKGKKVFSIKKKGYISIMRLYARVYGTNRAPYESATRKKEVVGGLFNFMSC